jgi:5-methylcytosine-specific restriction enzyme A
MTTISGVRFADSVAPLVTRVIERANELVGGNCVYKLRTAELRCALEPASKSHRGKGVFTRITPTTHGATMQYRGVNRTALSEATIDKILNQMPSWVRHARLKRLVDVRKSQPQRGPSSRNPAWTRDELILALDLYFRVPPWTINNRHAEIVKLSEELQALSAYTDRPDEERYRNPNGAYMKLMNLRTLDPSQNGKGLSGAGQADRAVWNEFAGNQGELRKIASAIRRGLNVASNEELRALSVTDVDEIVEAREGSFLTRLHRVRERNAKIVASKKRQAMNRDAALRCEVCSFDFAIYGEIGRDYIECHHVLPLAELPDHRITTLKDLALLCANCHRMAHRRRQWLSLTELRSLLTHSKR